MKHDDPEIESLLHEFGVNLVSAFKAITDGIFSEAITAGVHLQRPKLKIPIHPNKIFRFNQPIFHSQSAVEIDGSDDLDLVLIADDPGPDHRMELN